MAIVFGMNVYFDSVWCVAMAIGLRCVALWRRCAWKLVLWRVAVLFVAILIIQLNAQSMYELNRLVNIRRRIFLIFLFQDASPAPGMPMNGAMPMNGPTSSSVLDRVHNGFSSVGSVTEALARVTGMLDSNWHSLFMFGFWHAISLAIFTLIGFMCPLSFQVVRKHGSFG